MQFRLTNHVQTQAAAKGISLDKVNRVLAQPAQITNVSRYPNQSRYIGEGIAVIVSNDGAVITVYLDGVLTPLRPDQIARGETIRRSH